MSARTDLCGAISNDRPYRDLTERSSYNDKPKLPDYGQTAPYCLSSGPNRSGDGGGLLTSCRPTIHNTPSPRLEPRMNRHSLHFAPLTEWHECSV
jgi:hypothetical protein